MPTTSVIVLRAEGRSFSAGFDIGGSPDRGKDTGAADPNTWDPMLHRSFDFGMAPWSTTKPVIASVQGHVLGGGCELAMMCDLTIAADDAKFGEPEVRFSHLGPLMVMPWFIGLKRARELLLFGDMIDAKTALEFGMVNRIVPAAELRQATMKYAKRLSLISPEALRWGKRVINRGAEIAGFRAAHRSRRRLVRLALCHPDRGRQGVRPHRPGEEPQGRARVARRAIPRMIPSFVLILVKHLLNLIRLSRLGQSQLQKDACLLRAQIVGGDEARLLPVVVAHHPPGAHARAAHDHNAACVVKLLESLSSRSGCDRRRCRQ